jgi:regulator of sirC expression with transglutaminase-like and TPR domain
VLKPLKVILCILPYLLYGEDLFLTTRLQSLDPLSVAQHCAFYELYPDTKEGKKAIAHVWTLLLKANPLKEEIPLTTFPITTIESFVSIVTKQKFTDSNIISQNQLEILEKISDHLANRSLRGHKTYNKQELLQLQASEIDLGRILLVEQFDNEIIYIRHYEALLDFMALQILARLPENPTAENKIQEINRFIFYEMKFHFPPHSIYAANIDLFTLLPSIMDNRQGVCLGISALYLCLAQRLDLPLEIITPPGHIYLSYGQTPDVINIETTARGVHFPSETYLGINTRSLQKRTLKEVVGLVIMNQASLSLRENDYKKTITFYEKAKLYLPEDPLLNFWLGFNYLFIGKTNQGKNLLKPFQSFTYDWQVSEETMPQDYLNGNVDVNGIKAVMLPVDETRESILTKIEQIQSVLIKYPNFREGLLELAVSYLQIGRKKEALNALETYHQISQTNSVVEYYISSIAMERMNYNKAWKHLQNAEDILKSRNHTSKILRNLRTQLCCTSPEPDKSSAYEK